MNEPPIYQLIDEEEWFNIYGLRMAEEAGVGSENENDRETQRRIASEQAYQEQIHAKIFGAEDLEEENGHEDDDDCHQVGGGERSFIRGGGAGSKRRRREKQLEKWEHEEIDIRLEASLLLDSFPSSASESNEAKEQSPKHVSSSFRNTDKTVIIRVNLKALASRSDTVFAMASYRHLFQNTAKPCNGTDKSENIGESKSNPEGKLSLSLCDYPVESVKIFLRVLLPSPLTKNADAPSDTETIPPEHVIDCCRLAHYLQCQDLLDSIVDDYLMAEGSIDNENCRFLSKLADELSLPRLWEASVNHMLSSLDRFDGGGAGITKKRIDNDINDDNDNDNDNKTPHYLWEDLSPDLQREIQALRGILRSSNRKKVYFSSYHEYLALLAEQHQYYRERLDDARHGLKMRLEEDATLRKELELLEQERRYLGGRSSRMDLRIKETTNRLEGLSRGTEYAISKIEPQARRVDTLKALLVEQKKIFGGGELL